MVEEEEVERAIAHRWIYVIIPVAMDNASTHFPLFSAWCKTPGCSKYFTFPLAYSKSLSRSGTVPLPEYGCVEDLLGDLRR